MFVKSLIISIMSDCSTYLIAPLDFTITIQFTWIFFKGIIKLKMEGELVPSLKFKLEKFREKHLHQQASSICLTSKRAKH